MITPVAARLRALLDENPARANRKCTLVITGHSAGGAVAALLYAHMMTSVPDATVSHPPSRVHSALTALTPSFKRVHCITFGAPPVSLLPLRASEAARRKKSMFFAFVNEGDPVVRADKAVVASLLKLYAAPAPVKTAQMSLPVAPKASGLAMQMGLPLLGVGSGNVDRKQRDKRGNKDRKGNGNGRNQRQQRLPEWRIPPSTLSNAGRLILLREGAGGRRNASRQQGRTSSKSNGRAKLSSAGPDDGGRARLVAERAGESVEACVVTDEQLRCVVFGDPVCHMMSLYARRIETLAMRAVTVRDFG